MKKQLCNSLLKEVAKIKIIGSPKDHNIKKYQLIKRKRALHLIITQLVSDQTLESRVCSHIGNLVIKLISTRLPRMSRKFILKNHFKLKIQTEEKLCKIQLLMLSIRNFLWLRACLKTENNLLLQILKRKSENQVWRETIKIHINLNLIKMN